MKMFRIDPCQNIFRNKVNRGVNDMYYTKHNTFFRHVGTVSLKKYDLNSEKDLKFL